MKAALAFLVLFCFAVPSWAQHGEAVAAEALDLKALDQELQTNGLQGWVHGAAPEFNQYVFTWRDPNDFFFHFEFPMITANPALKAELAKLGRHDAIVIKGKFASLQAPVRHIRISSLQVVSKFSSGVKAPHFVREAKMPADLEGKTELIGKVHAVVDDGKILVIEYKDAVVPVFVTNNVYSKDLYRNDKIKLHYVLRKHPNSPAHVELDPAVTNPIEVMTRMTDLHGKQAGGLDKTGKPIGTEGVLVMFPKSPQIIFNVFAIQETDSDGVKVEHTLINFDDPAVFKAMREKLQKMWDAEASTLVDARNKFINPKIRLRAFGEGNMIDPGQANPQILIKSEADLVRIP